MDKQQRGIQMIRIRLGVTMLIHGVMKVASSEDTLAFSTSTGLPGLFVYGIAAIELTGRLSMITNSLIPLVSVGLIAVLVGAIFSFGLASGFSGYECELFLTMANLAILVSYANEECLALKFYF